MDILLDKTRKIAPINSVTNDVAKTDEQKNDTESPFSFLEWIDNTGLAADSPEMYMNLYTKYVKKWTLKNKLNRNDADQLIISRYKSLLKDIALNYTTDDEKRFLSNIDYNNPRHVESALPFFARKLKQIALYYTQERDNIKQQGSRVKLSGTTLGVSELAYKYIPQLIRRDDFTLKYQNDTIEISSEDIYTNFKVDVDELYDVSQQYFKGEQLPIDRDIYLDITQAIQQVLEECKPVLKLSTGASLILNNTPTSVETEVSTDDVLTINSSFFQEYKQEISELNIYNETQYIPTLIGSDISYLSGGVLTPVVSSENLHKNIFNRTGPSINNSEKPELKSIKELGGYFTPNKLGVLTYYSNQPTFEIYSDNVESFTPDLNKYGNSPAFGLTGIPVDHTESVTWLKAGIGTGRLKGDIIDSKSYQKFYNYSSIEEHRKIPSAGVSRTTDSVGFFDGDKADVWSMDDIYDLPAANVYDIDTRQETLLVSKGTLVSWRSDLYGNEYALYKNIAGERSPTASLIEQDLTEQEINVTCETIDGGESLVKHPDMYGDTFFEIYDGGRHPGLDPKPEQSNLPKPFPDIRLEKFTGDSFIIPEHTAEYFGYDPTGTKQTLDRYPITFFGFQQRNEQPAYDRQMYCGLFTDEACGVIAADIETCNVADNYVFETFTDTITGDNRMSTHYQLEKDAFERYTAPGTGDNKSQQNPEYVGFSTWGQSTDDINITEAQRLDGDEFVSDACKRTDAEYFYNINTNIPLFLGETNVSKTERSEPRNITESELTLYEQKTAPIGKAYFRSYNGKYITPLKQAIARVINNYNFFQGSDLDQIYQAIENENIVDIDVLYDVLVIQTDKHLYIEKIQFNPTTCEIEPTGLPNVILRNWDTDPSREKTAKWFFNEKNNKLLTANTCLNNDTVYLKLFAIDINTLEYKQVFPNTDYVENHTSFSLPLDIQDAILTNVDTPIIAYNEMSDTYNITYSAILSSGNQEAPAFVSSYFKDRKLNFQLEDVNLHYTEFVESSMVAESRVTATVDLPGMNIKPTPVMPPAPKSHETFNMSLSALLGHTLSAQTLDLEIVPANIPVQSNMYKLNEIVVDFSDNDVQKSYRLIDTNVVGVVDLTTLPDPGDPNDPRQNNFNHTYQFNNDQPETLVVTVSAIYGDFSTLTYFLNIEVSPYTIATGFSGIKLLNNKVFTDLKGDSKHILTLETQHPRHVTDVVLAD